MKKTAKTIGKIVKWIIFDEIKAPDKKMYIMENITHGLLESRSEDFSEILHEIAELINNLK